MCDFQNKYFYMIFFLLLTYDDYYFCVELTEPCLSDHMNAIIFS